MQVLNPTSCTGLSQKSSLVQGIGNGDFVNHITNGIWFSSPFLLSLGSISSTLIVQACTQQKTERWKKIRKRRKSQNRFEKEARNQSLPLFWLFITTFISVHSLFLLPHFPQKLMAKPTVNLNRALGLEKYLEKEPVLLRGYNTPLKHWDARWHLAWDIQRRNTKGPVPVLAPTAAFPDLQSYGDLHQLRTSHK